MKKPNWKSSTVADRLSLALVVVTLALLALGGCRSEGERLARMAEEHTKHQAEQNRAVTRMVHDTNQEHGRVMKSIEKSRTDLLSLQRDIDRQRQTLETERRAIAHARYRDSILAPTIEGLGLILATLLPVLALTRIFGRSDTDDVSTLALPNIHELVLETVQGRAILRGPKTSGTSAHTDSEPDPPELPF